jgi:hypothetical protein
MAWEASKTTLTGLNTSLSETTNSDSDYTAANHFSQWVTLNPGESAQVQVEAAFAGTGTDMFFRVVGTLDDATENADTVSFVAGSVPFTASVTVRRSVIVSGLYKFRVEVRKGGTTAGAYTPNVYTRKNGINA